MVFRGKDKGLLLVFVRIQHLPGLLQGHWRGRGGDGWLVGLGLLAALAGLGGLGLPGFVVFVLLLLCLVLLVFVLILLG